ncbi:MAG: LamG-like jellyroll fold domain-containing protein, partial [Verrucomicrobiota bacterium]
KDNSALNITHSIITANKGITCLDSAVCVSIYNDVFCINQNYSGTSAGAGCISTNPLYTDIGDYSLKEQSPCWTAGYMQLSIGWQLINLVENSGFELGTTAWGSDFYKTVMAISSDALSGNNALKVTMPGSNYYEGVYSICYPVEKGKTYTASAYVAGRTAGVRPRVRICLYSERDGWTYANQTTELNWGWQKISVTKTITATNDALRIQILTWDGPQAVTLHVDKVELMETKDYKMVYNGDFELGTTTWGSAKNAAMTISSDALSENNALKVTTPGSNYYEGVYSGLSYPVERGKTYTASAYVARRAGQGRVRICLYSERDGWTYANQTTELNWGWQKISVTKTITAVNDSLSIQILTWDGPQAVTFHVDKVELMEAKDYRMMYNGDFELGTAAWGSAKNAALATTVESMSGKGLKVTTPGLNYCEGVYSGLSYPVERGKTYTASAYVARRAGQGRVRICLYSERDGWTYASQTTELNSEWQKISVTKTITASNDALRVQILTWDGPQAITLYVDDVELKAHVDNVEPEDDNEVGYWKLDEGAGTTAYDSSWRGNNGTLQGNPQWANGRINGALCFNGNGTSDYIDCGSNASLKVSAVTISAWVYSPATNFSGYNEVAGVEGAYGLNIWNNKMAVHINTVNQGWHWCMTSGALSWDGWHHVAFTYDGVNTVKCYQDGVLVLTDTGSSSGQLQWAAWATKLYIGQINISGDRRLFKGMIDEVRIYNYPLTSEEIRNEWQNENVGYWKLDEGAGTTASDSSWRGNNGTLQGNPQWVNGRINGALCFNGNGTSDYIDCSSNASLKVSAVTISAWVYSPATNFSGYNEVAGVEGAYGLNIWNNKIAVHINTVNQGWHWCITSGALAWDGWHHVAFTYDGVNTVKCYQDGVLVLTDTGSSSGQLQWAAWATKLYIGQINIIGDRRLFKGMIDEVKIYNRPLRDDEIGNDMQGEP